LKNIDNGNAKDATKELIFPFSVFGHENVSDRKQIGNDALTF
jgi:hypothetical protein